MVRMWLLVEWLDEKNVISSYGIVNIDTFSFKESDMKPGKKICLSLKHNEPREAQIIRISDMKNSLQLHKEFLERQDQQVKNVLQLCMRTIKEVKSEQYSANGDEICRNRSPPNSLPHVINAFNENSGSDDDETEQLISQRNRGVKHQLKKVARPPNSKECYVNRSVISPVANQTRRSMISSTPLPVNRPKENIKLCFDQGTQTDNLLPQPSLAKIEEMESVLKQLYGRFQTLLLKVNNNNNTNMPIDLSETENNDVSYVDPAPIYNEAWVPRNNVELEDQRDLSHDQRNLSRNGELNLEDQAEPFVENNAESKAHIKLENERSVNKENPSRVRRMSAQTTGTEMLSIGDGNAMVPERLFKDIDWRSYTMATRQLLQAIFPRKVLATHSLTGKQSPAHLNKPPKKLLDPLLVEDIVKTVSERCSVPKNLVRNSITVKCTDEAKLFRNRQRHKLMAQAGQNQENIPPITTPSSDDSANVVS